VSVENYWIYFNRFALLRDSFSSNASSSGYLQWNLTTTNTSLRWNFLWPQRLFIKG